jgi:hypothetical protein
MARYDVTHADAIRDELQLEVTDIAGLTRDYARLGLRVVQETSQRAVIELPCGVTLVLSRRASYRRVTAA